MVAEVNTSNYLKTSLINWSKASATVRRIEWLMKELDKGDASETEINDLIKLLPQLNAPAKINEFLMRYMYTRTSLWEDLTMQLYQALNKPEENKTGDYDLYLEEDGEGVSLVIVGHNYM